MCFICFYCCRKKKYISESTPKKRVVFTRTRKTVNQVEYYDSYGVVYFVDPLYIYDSPLVIIDINNYDAGLFYNGENGIGTDY